MCKFNPKNQGRRLDPCMNFIIKSLKNYKIPTVASCCGHGKYSMTIIVEQKKLNGEKSYWDLRSGTKIPRKKKFYKKDKQGVYYIPEVRKR